MCMSLFSDEAYFYFIFIRPKYSQLNLLSNVSNATPTLNLPQLLQKILVTHFMVNRSAYAFFDQKLWWCLVESLSPYKCSQVVLTEAPLITLKRMARN